MNRKNPFKESRRKKVQTIINRFPEMSSGIKLAIATLALLGILALNEFVFPRRNGNGQCGISLGEYRGEVYRTEDTIKVECLVESKFLKVQQHTIRAPGSDALIDDWLWIDYHNRINVLVEDENEPGKERSFLIFKQSKYALEGRTSLAIVGGIIEPGEEAETAARREVEEETGKFCEKFHSLGRFRTDVNRGAGWVFPFLATKCHPVAISHPPRGDLVVAGAEEADEVGAKDMEPQDETKLSLSELREAARKGAFVEVQWSNTVALALLHLEVGI